MDTDETIQSEEGAERKLTCVMFTDIKGFSRKMAQNEGGAFDLLKKHDAMLRVLSNKYGGKVVKSIGDSFMVDFASAVNAVKCAIEAQSKFHNHNKGLSEFERIEIRVGIHLGDVLVRDEDIFGDGVNIASRIESIAEPTRICISADVHNQVRNKMDLETFRIGAMRLKNIPEPVEVFEILIPGIPEFSQPSKKATELSKKHELEASEKHAQRVARGGVHQPTLPLMTQAVSSLTDDERRRLAEEYYERAEKYFQMGRIEEAEAELKRVEELDPGYAPSDNRQKEEEEKETKTQEMLEHARELIGQGKLDEAEKETRSVFELYPLHVGAQQILLRIEEERYRVAEERRAQRISEQKRRTEETEDQKKIETLFEEAKKKFADESYSDAIYTLRDLYVLDPNHTAARELEKEIQAAQKEKAERDRIAAEEEERRLEAERIEHRKRRREQARRTVSRTERQVRKKGISPQTILTGVGIIVVGVLLYFALPSMIRTMFPVRISVAAVPFTAPPGNAMAPALASMLMDDLSRVNNVTILAPTTSFQLDTRTMSPEAIGAALNVTHLLSGSIDSSDQGYELTVRLYDVQDQSAASARKFPLPLTRLADVRLAAVEAIIDDVGLDGRPAEISQSTAPETAIATYLSVRALLDGESPEGFQTARSQLESLVVTGVEFAEGVAGYAEAIARLARTGAVPDEQVSYAIDLAQQASRQAPTDASVLRSLAVTLIAGGRFDQAQPLLVRAAEISPQHAESHRLLTEVWLAGGDMEKASASLSRAVSLDPLNPRTRFLQGLYAHVRNDNVEAARLYEASISSGGNRAYILSGFLSSAWLRGTKRDAAVAYFQSALVARPDDIRGLYLLGRAYAEKLDSAQVAFDRGLRLTTAALDVNNDDPRALAFHALFLTRLGRFQNALTPLQRLERLGPTDPVILYRIANVYALQNKKDEALKAVTVAVDRKFLWSEVLNPDFASLFDDPGFRQRVNRPLRPPQ